MNVLNGLTCDILCKDNENGNSDSDDNNGVWSVRELWLLLLVMCSSLAGVYNEKYLRNQYKHIPVLIQGIHYYFYGMLFNLIAFCIISNSEYANQLEPFTKGWNLSIFWIIVILNACVGLCYAFLFKYLGALNQNIVRGSAVIVVFFFELLFFHHVFVLNTFCAMLIIITAISLWTQVPTLS